MATNTAVEVVMPQMGVSVSEGTITKWSKQVGDTVEADETLLEISTDKVDTEVPSPASGVVTEILVSEGETVEVGTVLARIGSAAGGSVPAAPPAPEPAPTPTPTPERVAEAPVAPESVPAPAAPVSQPAQSDNGRSFVSPVVARIAAEHGIDPTQVPGSGGGGRVTKKDIKAFIEAGPPAPPVASEPAPAPEPAAEVAAPAPAPAPAQAVTIPQDHESRRDGPHRAYGRATRQKLA